MEAFVSKLSGFLWGNYMIILCLGVGIFLTIRLKGFQFRYLIPSIRLVKEKNTSSDGVSSFQAFCMALAGRIGTGNIVGVATAIAAGGPGAVFWMWVLALFGACTSFAECTLAQVYKERKLDTYRGGPAFYISKGLKYKSIAHPRRSLQFDHYLFGKRLWLASPDGRHPARCVDGCHYFRKCKAYCHSF